MAESPLSYLRYLVITDSGKTLQLNGDSKLSYKLPPLWKTASDLLGSVMLACEKHQVPYDDLSDETIIKMIDDAIVSKKDRHFIELANKSNEKDDEEKKKQPLMKFTGSGYLVEAVKIAGLPCFIRYENGRLMSYTEIEEPNRVIIPFVEEEPAPYSFENVEELQAYIELAKQETYYSLYKQSKALAEKYCDLGESAKVVFAADLVFSYFQDKIGMTHYLFPYGLPGTGKGAMLELAHQVAYRAVLFASARAASIYRTLGTAEPGQACLLIDEANNLDENPDLQEVLKTGYKLNGMVPRVLDASSSSHTAPTYFRTFCWKMIAAERLPSEYNAAGFLSRTFRMKTYYGKPAHKIDKVVGQHEKNKKLGPLYDELVNLRKVLFAFRLLHYDNEIVDVKLNIDGRPEELCLPLVQVFRNTEAEAEILGALSEFVIESQNEKADGFDAYLYAKMKEMLDASQTTEFENATIWNMLRDLLCGEDVQDKRDTMRTAQFGDITKTRVTKTLEKFGAKRDRDSTGTKRILRFDRTLFDKFCAMFDVPKRLEIVSLSDTSDSTDTFSGHDGPGVEVQEGDNHAQNATLDDPENDPRSSLNVSEASEVSDAYACPHCTFTADNQDQYERHIIKVHPGKPGYPGGP